MVLLLTCPSCYHAFWELEVKYRQDALLLRFVRTNSRTSVNYGSGAYQSLEKNTSVLFYCNSSCSRLQKTSLPE